jgi:hypothetical protein
MRYLPVWTSIMDVGEQGQQRLHSVAAVDALLLTDEDIFFPDLTAEHSKFQFVTEVPKVKKLIEKLGGRRLLGGDYAVEYVCPYLPRTPPDALLPTIFNFLQYLVDICERHSCSRVLRDTVLIADRT